jgi:hypothetical protein
LRRDEGSDRTSETVRLVTLDDCLRRHGWKQIDLLKIDAEGEEASIVEGGRRFFAEQSPLILFELKTAADVPLDLVGKFASLGFESYRLVPGLDMLVPFDAATKPDGYLLNLFCCKKDRADLLSDRGLLLNSSSIASYKAGNRFDDSLEEHRYPYRWEVELVALPYGAAFAHLWRAMSSQNAEVTDALACFAMSHDVDLSTLERFVALERSFMTLVDLSQRQPQYMRLASLARAARDYGARSVAVAALGQLSKKLVEGERVDLHEPFLAPGQRFDAIAPRALDPGRDSRGIRTTRQLLVVLHGSRGSGAPGANHNAGLRKRRDASSPSVDSSSLPAAVGISLQTGHGHGRRGLLALRRPRAMPRRESPRGIVRRIARG